VAKRIEVDWDAGGFLDVTAYCARTPAPGKLYNMDIRFVDSVADQVTMDVPAGTEGQILFHIKVEYEIKRTTIWYIKYRWFPRTGSPYYNLRWDYKCTPDGQLTLTQDRTGYQGWSGPVNMDIGATDLTNPASDSGPPYIDVVAALSYAGDQEGDVTLGSGPVTIPVPRQSPKSGSGKLGMRIKFNVTGKKKESPFVLPVSKTLYFEHEGQPDLDRNVKPDNRLQSLQDWVDNLRSNKEFFEAVSKGYVVISLKGYASKTDTDIKDFDLSDVRVKNVQRRLERMLGTPSGKPLLFDSVARGKFDKEALNAPDVLPAQRDSAYLKYRRVELDFDLTKAIAQIKRMRQGLPPTP
jgi:hypothetical protein